MSVSVQHGVAVRPGQYLVKFREPRAAELADGEPLSEDLVLIRSEAPQLVQKLDGVEYVIPNHCYRREQAEQVSTPNSDQWGLHNEGQNGGKPDADIDAPEAWQVTTGSSLVAVLDTGIDLHHPDLRNNLYLNEGEIPGDGIDNDENGVVDDVHGYDASAGTGEVQGDDPHGTHCAGTIVASGKVLGVAPTAKVLPIKIYDEDEWTDAATIIRAVNYARKAGAQVASHSYGGLGFNRAVRETLGRPDMLHVVAAGNYHSNNDVKKNYPASYNLPNMITVAASDRHDRIAGFSNFGSESVHLAAPGVEILSTVNYGGHGTWNGTSMACPHVTGTAALVATKFADQTPVQWKEKILGSVDKQPGWDTKVATGGRLNAARALED